MSGLKRLRIQVAHSKHLLDLLTSKDVTYTLIADGDHSQSRQTYLRHIEHAIFKNADSSVGL